MQSSVIVEFRVFWKIASLILLVYINIRAWKNYEIINSWDLEGVLGYILFSIIFLMINISHFRFAKYGWRSGVKIFNRSFEKSSLIPWEYKYLSVGGIWPLYGLSFITYVPWHWNFFLKNFGNLVVFIDENVSCDLMDQRSRDGFKKFANKYRDRL